MNILKFCKIAKDDMGVSDFDGKTFVAYVDISGFKKMMKNRQKL